MTTSVEYEAIIRGLDALDEIEVCMNPRAVSCSVCIFNDRTWPSGIPWCNPEERQAKQLFDIERTKGEAA